MIISPVPEATRAFDSIPSDLEFESTDQEDTDDVTSDFDCMGIYTVSNNEATGERGGGCDGSTRPQGASHRVKRKRRGGILKN